MLLDTHIALWLDTGDPNLSLGTRDAIDARWKQGETIYLSAVSVWEIAMLVDRGRVTLDSSVETWTSRFLHRPGIEGLPLGVSAAMRSHQLHSFDNRDPADRLLIATAIELGCPLVTYDDRIRRFGEQYGQQYGFAVAA